MRTCRPCALASPPPPRVGVGSASDADFSAIQLAGFLSSESCPRSIPDTGLIMTVMKIDEDDGDDDDDYDDD